MIPLVLCENSLPVIRKATKSLLKGFSEDHWWDWVYLVTKFFPRSRCSTLLMSSWDAYLFAKYEKWSFPNSTTFSSFCELSSFRSLCSALLRSNWDGLISVLFAKYLPCEKWRTFPNQLFVTTFSSGLLIQLCPSVANSTFLNLDLTGHCPWLIILQDCDEKCELVKEKPKILPFVSFIESVFLEDYQSDFVDSRLIPRIVAWRIN